MIVLMIKLYHVSVDFSKFYRRCEMLKFYERMLLIPGTGNGERGTGNREPESGN